MDPKIVARLLPAVIKATGKTNITVTGNSMYPCLLEGDVVTIEQCEEYKTGDILVFDYKNEGLLIHRLLKHTNRYFCKGDNSFRLEDIDYNQIIGKAISVNQQPILPWESWKIDLSYAVNREFFKSHYNIQQTIKTKVYKLYSALVLKKEGCKMTYKKTDKMDFILSDKTSLAVFDPESGNTYFLDETGIDILDCLPCDLETLLQQLGNIYATTPEDIRSDVEEFLADIAEKGIVEIV